MSPRAAACAALVVAALGLALAPAPAGAHQRSQSFSTWRVDGPRVRATVSLLALEATRLAPPTGAFGDLGPLAAAHLAARVSLSRGGAACALESARPVRARPGHLRVELAFRCPETGTLLLTQGAFFDEAPSHVHFARVLQPGAPPRELLFRADARTQPLLAPASAGSPAQASGAGFASYLRLGVGHILGGLDHLAFLAALLLVGGSLREILFAVTGFTLGHSATLSLAALGLVRVDAPLVEATIGFSIALVAAEMLARRGAALRPLAGAAGLGLGLLAALALAGHPRSAPPALPLAGLALFSACYLQLAATPDAARRLRPAVTALFGLVHGFGFAGALLEAGLPRERLLAALLGFNVGVELAQIGAVVVLAAAAAVLLAAKASQRALAADLAAAGLCALGVFWFVARAYG
jgi:hypothetical protein